MSTSAPQPDPFAEAGLPDGRGVKPTEAELDARVSEVASRIVRGESRFSIVQFGVAEWDVCVRTVDNYIARAKKEVLAPAEAENRKEIRAAHRARLEDLLERARGVDNVKLELATLQELARFDDLYDFERNHTFSHDTRAPGEKSLEELEAGLAGAPTA